MKKTVYEWLMAVGHRAGCHQRADRSFYWKGMKFPLCARCTGVLVGYILAVPAYTVCRKNVSVYAVCCIPLVIDGLTQLWEWQVSTNRRRFATGALAGYGICSMAITLLLFVKNLMLRSW